MADTAVDINSYRRFLPQDDPLLTPEVSQPPAAPPAAPPPDPLIPPADAPPPAPTQVAQATPPAAMDTGAPPADTAAWDWQSRMPKAPAPTAALTPDAPINEEEEFKRALAENRQKYSGTLREHTGEFRPIKDQERFTVEQHPEFGRLQELLQLQQGYDKRQQREYGPRIEALKNRVIRETELRNKAANSSEADKRRNDLQQIDSQRETVAQAANTLGLVSGVFDTYDTKYKAGATAGSPEEKFKADYNSKTLPVGTMEPSQLREAGLRIATLNGLTPQLAAEYTMKLGRPVGIGPDGKPEVGLNGARGRAGMNFTLEGHDARGHAIVKMDDGRFLRVDIPTLQQLDRARLKGYTAGQRWHQEDAQKRTDAQKPDWIDRRIKDVREMLQ